MVHQEIYVLCMKLPSMVFAQSYFLFQGLLMTMITTLLASTSYGLPAREVVSHIVRS